MAKKNDKRVGDKPKRTPKLKQSEIPGTERPVIKALDEAGETYVDLRDKMQAAVKRYKEEGKTPLIDLMHKNADKLSKNGEGELVYNYDDMVIILKPTAEVIKVKHVDPEEVAVEEAPADETEGAA